MEQTKESIEADIKKWSKEHGAPTVPGRAIKTPVDESVKSDIEKWAKTKNPTK